LIQFSRSACQWSSSSDQAHSTQIDSNNVSTSFDRSKPLEYVCLEERTFTPVDRVNANVISINLELARDVVGLEELITHERKHKTSLQGTNGILESHITALRVQTEAVNLDKISSAAEAISTTVTRSENSAELDGSNEDDVIDGAEAVKTRALTDWLTE